MGCASICLSGIATPLRRGHPGQGEYLVADCKVRIMPVIDSVRRLLERRVTHTEKRNASLMLGHQLSVSHHVTRLILGFMATDETRRSCVATPALRRILPLVPVNEGPTPLGHVEAPWHGSCLVDR